ncbi:hypothetical protein KUCAC02_028266 [Chaenocephalus aceratus]|uniref:Uncharacterized protein n=1 Tax=Chaenocephalus aceratus TaxID=36190 RepID=A0ACB9X255_CHAAC|nr:hypothetical protein KUCAC02_028266 [Chaenocephalus aceratus]
MPRPSLFLKVFLINKVSSRPQIKVELESVQDELSGTRKDKFMLQAKVVELRNSMKTLLLQPAAQTGPQADSPQKGEAASPGETF